jgi:hypothetical protein
MVPTAVTAPYTLPTGREGGTGPQGLRAVKRDARQLRLAGEHRPFRHPG